MKRTRLLPACFSVLAAGFLLAGCVQRAEEASDQPRFAPVADVQQLMLTVLEPAAEVYWDAVGWILDGEGTHEIRPSTGEEWEAVRNAAYVIAESGNLLLMQGRAHRAQSTDFVDGHDEAWTAMSQAMIAVGRRAIAAAEARDPDAVFDVGGQIYEACTACHARYALETLRPSDARR